MRRHSTVKCVWRAHCRVWTEQVSVCCCSFSGCSIYTPGQRLVGRTQPEAVSTTALCGRYRQGPPRALSLSFVLLGCLVFGQLVGVTLQQGTTLALHWQLLVKFAVWHDGARHDGTRSDAELRGENRQAGTQMLLQRDLSAELMKHTPLAQGKLRVCCCHTQVWDTTSTTSTCATHPSKNI